MIWRWQRWVRRFGVEVMKWWPSTTSPKREKTPQNRQVSSFLREYQAIWNGCHTKIGFTQAKMDLFFAPNSFTSYTFLTEWDEHVGTKSSIFKTERPISQFFPHFYSNCCKCTAQNTSYNKWGKTRTFSHRFHSLFWKTLNNSHPTFCFLFPSLVASSSYLKNNAIT